MIVDNRPGIFETWIFSFPETHINSVRDRRSPTAPLCVKPFILVFSNKC